MSAGWLDDFFGPPVVFDETTELPKRSKIVFEGEGVSAEDDDVDGVTRVKVSGTVLAGNQSGEATITATKVIANGDSKITETSIIGHATTADDTPITVTLDSLDDPDLLSVSAEVTVRNSDGTKRGRWNLSELAYREGGAPAFEAGGTGEDASPKTNDGALEAKLVFSGNTIRLEFTGLAATNLTWGYVVRTQRQGV